MENNTLLIYAVSRSNENKFVLGANRCLLQSVVVGEIGSVYLKCGRKEGKPLKKFIFKKKEQKTLQSVTCFLYGN
jgi:hypothetical protein